MWAAQGARICSSLFREFKSSLVWDFELFWEFVFSCEFGELRKIYISKSVKFMSSGKPAGSEIAAW